MSMSYDITPGLTEAELQALAEMLDKRRIKAVESQHKAIAQGFERNVTQDCSVSVPAARNNLSIG